MKTSEIQIGVEYAVGNDSYAVKQKVVAIEKNAEKRVYSGNRSDYLGHTSKGTWIRVERASYDGQVFTDLVKPQTILRTWEAHMELTNKAEARRQAVEDRYRKLESRWEELTGSRIYIERVAGVARINASDLAEVMDRVAELLEQDEREAAS